MMTSHNTINMAAPVKLEFIVRMTCQTCVEDISKTLVTEGIKVLAVDLGSERVLVETSLPSDHVKNIIESTGRMAVLQGLSSGKGESPMGAAVAMMSGLKSKGVIRLVQVDKEVCVIEGTVDGLSLGQSQLCVHELGDLSSGCLSCGDVYNSPENKDFSEKSGEIGTVTADKDGRAVFRLSTPKVKVWDIIGRSMVIHENRERIACGIIARSSGIFENAKRICACDGVTIWDERNVPIAGEGRQKKASETTAQL